MAEIRDHALALDSFLNPVTYKDRSAVEMLICRLILLEPGTFQTHPDMGVGIVSRYRYAPKSELSNLSRDIENQISTYLPDVHGVEVKCTLPKDGILRIAVKLDDQVYALSFNTSEASLKPEKLDVDKI